MINAIDSSSARLALQRYRALDNAPADADPRPDFVELSEVGHTHEIALTAGGYVQRSTDSSDNVTVTQARLPRWFELGTNAAIDSVCRSAQGAYSGWLGGVAIGADTQDSARQVFYAWQKPFVKPGGG